MVKIALIGAGSGVFAQRMITDIVAIPGLEGGSFALVDIDSKRLELAHQVAELTIKAAGKPWSHQATTDRRGGMPRVRYHLLPRVGTGHPNIRPHQTTPPQKSGTPGSSDRTGPRG